MSTTAIQKTAKRARLRRFVQFRLSTVLLATLLAAVGMFFYTLPEVVEEDDETGKFRSVYQIYRDDDGKPVRHGVAKLYDQAGSKVYQQYFRSGEDHGRWAFWSLDGSRWEGEVRDGQRYGTWTQWYPDGEKQSEATYVDGQLHGLDQAWWPDGTPKYAGSYQKGRRSGKWTFWNERGETISTGDCRDGQKHGTWQQRDEKAGTLVAQQYIRGRRVENAQQVVKQWRQHLFGENYARRAEAVWALGELAHLGVPVLEDALTSGDPDLHRRAFVQLARNRDWGKANIPQLIAALDDGSFDVRWEAMASLARVGPAAKAALPRLEQLAKGPDTPVRYPAAGALASIAPERDAFIEMLIEEFASVDPVNYPAVHQADTPTITIMPRPYFPYLSRNVIDGLCRVLRRGDPKARAGSAELLTSFEPPPREAVPRAG